MIDAEGHVKIIDLEYSKRIRGRTFTQLGSPGFMAPEVILGKGYSFKADIWSFGITLCELLTGHSPFNTSEDPIQVYERQLSLKFSLPKCNKTLQNLIQQCLIPEEED